MNQRNGKNNSTAIVVLSGIVFMLGLSFAAVPLYRIFCQKTGFGGTPMIVSAPYLGQSVLSREMKVQFNADTGTNLLWKFQPLQHETKVLVGQNVLAFYEAKNLSNQSITGMATYNVTPDKVAKYFNKIICFCFIEQTLRAGQSMHMPVQFYLDPAIEDDKNCRDVKVITLSYTFHRYKPGLLREIMKDSQ